MIRKGDTVYYFPPMLTRARYALPAVVRATVREVWDFGNRATLTIQALTYPMTDLLVENVRVVHTAPSVVPEGTCMERWPSRLEFNEWSRRRSRDSKTFLRRNHAMSNPMIREAVLAWRREEAQRERA